MGTDGSGLDLGDLSCLHKRVGFGHLFASHLFVVKGAGVLIRVSVTVAVEVSAAALEASEPDLLVARPATAGVGLNRWFGGSRCSCRCCHRHGGRCRHRRGLKARRGSALLAYCRWFCRRSLLHVRIFVAFGAHVRCEGVTIESTALRAEDGLGHLRLGDVRMFAVGAHGAGGRGGFAREEGPPLEGRKPLLSRLYLLGKPCRPQLRFKRPSC
mmetsp:Transcript_24658/g.67083  ORF Transcript_24658/g.67083 Transcript_24658/m.67083 type:complete len:213 (+) Transcript_24658:562-1200(+)